MGCAVPQRWFTVLPWLTLPSTANIYIDATFTSTDEPDIKTIYLNILQRIKYLSTPLVTLVHYCIIHATFTSAEVTRPARILSSSSSISCSKWHGDFFKKHICSQLTHHT